MQRIIKIKEPFHPLPLAALTVIERKHRDREGNHQLQHAVYLVDEDEVDGCVHRDKNHHPCHLLFEIPAVRAKGNNYEHCDAAPVSAERYHADEDHDRVFLPLLQPLAVHDRECHKPPGKRPHYARLVEYARLKRHKRDPEREIVSEMRDQRKKEQPCGVTPAVMRIVVTFRNEEAHDRRGKPADGMQQKKPRSRLISGEDHPGQVIHRHCNDGDELQCVSAQAMFFRAFHFYPSFFSRFVASFRSRA